MPYTNTKFDASDPSFYDHLISNQKKYVRMDSKNSAQWLELGILQEAKVEITKYFVEKYFIIRGLPVMTYMLFIISWVCFYFYPPPFILELTWKTILPIFIVLIASLIQMTLLRYPRSGSRYFRKALSLNPDCADVYIQLGKIALRRRQKKRGCFLLEQALKKGYNKKIERELKTIYEKEYSTY